jgi:single-stranded DNA-binding protein
MNAVQLSGILTVSPLAIERRQGIRFVIKARYPSEDESNRMGIAYIPCTVFDATKEQREILLGKNFRNFVVELSGRLVISIYENEKGESIYSTEVVVNPHGLLIRQRRK